MFSVKDPSLIRAPCICGIHVFVWVDETTQHFSTRVREHMFSDRASRIFKHLLSNAALYALMTVLVS